MVDNIPVDRLIEDLEDDKPVRPGQATPPGDQPLPFSIDDLLRDQEIRAYINAANDNLGVRGFAHGSLVAPGPKAARPDIARGVPPI